MGERRLVTLRLSAMLLALTLPPASTQAQLAVRLFDQVMPLAPQEQVATTTATVHGVVVNSLTGQPIARTLVSLQSLGQSMLTDNRGLFSFENVPVGKVVLSASRPDFGGSCMLNGPVNVTVSSGSSPEITLSLTPCAAITGELIQPGEDAPDTLTVSLLRRQVDNGRSHWELQQAKASSEEGRFRFGNLRPGDYLIQVGASMDPAPADTGKLRYGYPPVFYSNARDISGATVISVSPGQQADVRLGLTREPFYPVVIPVANLNDGPPPGFSVFADPFARLPARYSSSDGMVHMELPSGHYTLQASGSGPARVSGQREFDVNPARIPASASKTSPMLGPPITLLPGSDIPVTVRSELTHNSSGQPDSSDATSLIGLDLVPEVARGNTGIHLQSDPRSDDSSAALLPSVAPGPYRVNAGYRRGDGYIASITSGGVDLLQQPLTVPADGAASPILVTVRDDMASLKASLSSSLQTSATQPVDHPIYLYLLPTSGSAVERTGTFQSDGTLSLGSLAPGGYLAVASSMQQEIEYRNPKVIAALAAKGKSVTLEPDGTAQITVDTLIDGVDGLLGGLTP